jgi:hypothetical protein
MRKGQARPATPSLRSQGDDLASAGAPTRSQCQSRSPWEYRATCGGNIVRRQRTLCWSKALRLRLRARHTSVRKRGAVERTGGNSERARSAVYRVKPGDVWRLAERGKLHRVSRSGEDSSLRRGNLKLGEPHGRLQGATNLQGNARSKPSKPGGTARAEHARGLAASRRRPVSAGREWTRTVYVDEGATR